MSEIARTHARPAIPAGLLGMLALVALFELCVAGRDRFSADYAENWRFKGRAAVREAARCEVLCFGDSMVEFGLVPSVVEKRLGRPAYNLALHAGTPASSYYLLRKVLDAGARPSAVVFDSMPHQMAAPPQEAYSLRAWPLLASPRELLDLAWSVRDADVFAGLAIAQALPSFRNRHEIRTGVFAELAGQDYSARENIVLLRRNWTRNQGAQVMPVTARYQGAVNPSNPGLFPAAWSCDPITVRYVRRFLRLAESKSIPVIWLVPPINPASQALRRAMGLDDSYDRSLREVQAEFPSLVIVDARRAEYDPSLFTDENHLNRDGALALSTDMVEVLARVYDGAYRAPRWIELPHYQPRTIKAPIEDLNQSRMALHVRSEPIR